MALKDTEEKLYDPTSDIDKREHSKSVFDLENSQFKSGNFLESKSWWERFQINWLTEDRRKAVYATSIVLGVIVAGVLVFFVLNKLKQTAFSEKNVIITVEGMTSTDSAREVEYVIKCKNKNRVALKKTEFILNHSENFYPNESESLKKINARSSRLEIGDIKSFGSKEIKISGKFYASENYTVYLQPVLKYEPSNFSSFFESSAQLGVKITNSPVDLVINAPREGIDESTIEYEINYENRGGQNLSSLNLRLEYPDGFIFQSAVPNPVSGDNTWHIGDLSTGAKGSVKIKGRLDGEQYDVKLIRATIFKNENNNSEIIYAKSEGVTKMVVPPLAVSHKINGKNSGNVNLGDNLNFVITYSNRGDIGLKDIIIKLKIDSQLIDYENLDLESGAYNSTNKDITWKAADIANLQKLEPGNGGEIKLKIPLKEKVDISSGNDKNFSIESIVTIDSSDVAFHSLGNSKNISNTIVSKLNSRVILDSGIYFQDDDIENHGPIPQKVGEETTYAVSWKITNVSNDISDVVVSAFLPTGVSWKDFIVPKDENITFNQRTNEIIWKIDKLESGTGILSGQRSVKFKIGLTPEINQVRESVSLLYKTKLTGKDDFTGNVVDVVIENSALNLGEFTIDHVRGNLIVK